MKQFNYEIPKFHETPKTKAEQNCEICVWCGKLMSILSMAF